MDKKTVAVVLAVVVVFLVVFFGFLGKRGQVGSPDVSDSGINQSGGAFPREATREPAPINLSVPGKDAENVPSEVAVPQAVYRGSPNGDVSYRSFAIKAEGGKFMPDTVIVKKGDTIDLNVSAVDRDYDFTQPDFGLRVVVPRGTTKRVQFGATVSGKFTFYCSVCGGPSSGPKGYVVIANK